MINSCALLGKTISVGYGGTGLTSTTVNGVLCGGTSTGSFQYVGSGKWYMWMAQGNNVPIWSSKWWGDVISGYHGGSGFSSFPNPNGLICAGSTNTVSLQNVGTAHLDSI